MLIERLIVGSDLWNPKNISNFKSLGQQI